MNYNHDTEMDLDWAADQLRRKKYLASGLPEGVPIRRTTATIPKAAPSRYENTLGLEVDTPVPPGGEATLVSALSALAINERSADHCQLICENLVVLLSGQDRVTLHAEFVQLKGVDAVLNLVREHMAPATVRAALRVLDKLSRTSAREIAAANGIDVMARCCEKLKDGGKAHPPQAPRVIEAALRALHGLTFDGEVKRLLLRRGVKELAELFLEEKADEVDQQGAHASPEEEKATAEAWADVLTISGRLLQRLGGQAAKGRRAP